MNNIFSKMGLSEEVQYSVNRVMHNVKFSFSAVVCAVIGISAVAGEFGDNKFISALLLLACVLGYIYSIMMINRYEEDEWEYA